MSWFEDIDSLPPAAQEFARQENAELTTFDVELDYDYWGAGMELLAEFWCADSAYTERADQILRSILPDELDVPSSFETAGHIGKAL